MTFGQVIKYLKRAAIAVLSAAFFLVIAATVGKVAGYPLPYLWTLEPIKLAYLAGACFAWAVMRTK